VDFQWFVFGMSYPDHGNFYLKTPQIYMNEPNTYYSLNNKLVFAF